MFEPDVSIAVWGVDVTAVDILPEEAEIVRRAVEKRRIEFARGRSCARAALQAAGGSAGPIGVGPHREPLFPEGFVGSITHCDGFVGALVAPDSVVSAVGVDAETWQRLTPEVADFVSTDSERSRLGEEGAGSLLFSAKEALFKAVFPLTGVWLGFHDVGLEVSDSSFSVVWTADGVDVPELARIHGRWRRAGDLVLSGCWIP